jgi:hypothetical protein
MSSLIETIDQASKDAGFRSFVYADFETEQEFQAVIDKFKFEEYPLLLIPPFQSNGTWLNGRRKGVLQIRGWALKRLKQDTNQYRSKDLEVSTIQPMKTLAKKFIKEMIASDVYDPMVTTVSDTIRGSYQFTNTHLFGAYFTVNLPIIESVC